jgi:hypothetical protein
VGRVARESVFGYISGPTYAWVLSPLTGVPDLCLGLCGRHAGSRLELNRSRLIGDARRHIENHPQGDRATIIAVLPTLA